MKKKISLTLLLSVFVFSALQAQVVNKKLLYFGWKVPQFLKGWQVPVEKLEQDLPFDGVGINPILELQRNGKTVRYFLCQARLKGKNPVQLNKKDLAPWIEAFKKLKFTRFKHNFVKTTTSTMSADWFDDEAWKGALNHFKMCAYLAKETGSRGIAFDVEAYPTTTDAPFAFRPQDKHPLEKVRAQVRKRGKEWIQALAEEYPDMELFTLHWLSFCHRNNRQSSFFLLPDFINGIYDGLPAGMTVIDGNEDPGYRALFPGEYTKIVSDYYFFTPKLIVPENRIKFYNQTLLATSLYLDSFISGTRSFNNWERTPNRVKALQSAVTLSLQHADKYAWIWAEKGTFWTGQDYQDRPDWHKTIPFVKDAIIAGRDPKAAALRYADKKNLAYNVRNWSIWLDDKAKNTGKITRESKSILFTDITKGSVTQTVRSKLVPGERYVFAVKMQKTTEDMTPYISCFFRNKKGKIFSSHQQKVAFGPVQADGWSQAVMIIDIPADIEISTMTLGCNVTGSKYGFAPNSKCRFSDARIHKVTYPWDTLPTTAKAAPAKTAPAKTAPAKTAPAKTAPAKTAPANKK